MGKNTTVEQDEQQPLAREDVPCQGVRELIAKAVQTELAELLDACSNVRLLDGRRAVVRNGYQPERQVLTGAGPVPVRIPKVRDRSGGQVKFTPRLVPPYVRRSARVSVALPRLYLKGISAGDMQETLRHAHGTLAQFGRIFLCWVHASILSDV